MGIEEEEEVESCGSRPASATPGGSQRQQRQKLEVYNEVLRRIQDSDPDQANLPRFEDQLWLHFNRLPARYALDVNVERAEDVLTHKRLLELAEDPTNRPAFQVRLVQVYSQSNGTSDDAVHSDNSMSGDTHGRYFSTRQGVHPPPTFGSSANLEVLALQGGNGYHVEDGDSVKNSVTQISRPMHEITFSTVDRPKLLSQLTSLLAEIGLNIQEAHAFSTVDGYSLDVFVVDGWDREETEDLSNALEKEIAKSKEQFGSRQTTVSAAMQNVPRVEFLAECIQIPNDGTDVWEIDARHLQIGNKVASGSFGDLYKGTYCSQEVAIKVLKPERVSAEMVKEFCQEVYIMRKIRHKNVVQFIGACTRPSNLCIVTEFMARGSIYDFLHKHKGVFKPASVIKVAIDVSRGMNYLHQNNIIHRDLKTANLLMDEHEVVKVADFGVARVQTESGVMTAETGTYRWMAPEVIEHKPYDHKADIFSFAIVLWELLTGELPYSFLTPLQAAVGVVQKDLRPTIPKHTNPKLAELLQKCWQRDPTQRPDFSEIIDMLQLIGKELGEDRKDKSAGGFFTSLMRGNH